MVKKRPGPAAQAPYGHKCAAEGCEKIVPSDMLMCRKHWFKVPKDIRDRVWASYRGGMDAEYDVAVAAAVDAIRKREDDAEDEGGYHDEAPLFDPEDAGR